MTLGFFKIEATGNDFIVLDNSIKIDPEQVKKLCRPHLGIGADGLIQIAPLENHAFRFNYFNRDGSRGEMCANGCRAAVLFALKNGMVSEGEWFTFLADDGPHRACFRGEDIEVEVHILAEPEAIATDISGRNWPAYSLNTGVPHVVFLSDEVEIDQFEAWARPIRYDAIFPRGTNVNLVQQRADGTVRLRTYERGVEAETLSCGTGICAAAIIAGLHGADLQKGVRLQSNAGPVFVRKKDKSLYIKGPARIVFKGEVEL